MGTQVMNDIHNDLKLLITSLSGFSEGEEGFQLCEKFALSQIKHHRYLSVNSHDVKKNIKAIEEKFVIYGKYDLAKEFENLIKTFLTSFDFELHPQYDIQWSLLSLLFNIANQTGKSQESNQGGCLNITTVPEASSNTDGIDWKSYLKDGGEEFFCDYKSSDSEDEVWTDEVVDSIQISQKTCISPEHNSQVIKIQESKGLEKSSKWLMLNTQNRWWNELDWRQERVDSIVEDAHLNERWRKHVTKSNKIIGTVSEYKACRELLWMFHSRQVMALFQKDFSIQQVSIPSLTTTAFKNMMTMYSPCFGMIQEMEDFVKKVFSSNPEASFTYEAYAGALNSQVAELKKKIMELETEWMKQDGQNTLLRLSLNLKRPTEKIRTLYKIHKKVVDTDGLIEDKWRCTSRLLSNLYFEMENSHNCQMTNACVNIYLSSISVYINLVDTWLSEGRLEDWRGEFVIAKTEQPLESLSSGEENRSIDSYLCRDLDEICKKDPIMRILVEKVYQMGRSIELLTTLDRISDLWDLMDEEKCPQLSLYEECLKEICQRISSYDPANEIQVLSISEVPITSPPDTDTVQSIFQRVSDMDNPFLFKVFESFLIPKEPEHGIVEKTLQIESRIELPWRKILECTMVKILDAKFNGASKLVKKILTNEYKLGYHLKLMRSVYMMEKSHVMNNFCHLIFTEIESNGMWNNSYFVTSLLEEVLSQEWPESTSRWSMSVSNVRTAKVLEAVNGINLQYAAGWPINMLLNEETLEKYNKIFKFEIKLKWALWTLNNLRFADLEDAQKVGALDVLQFFYIRRLESLRFWLLHSIGSIHAYLSGQVLSTLGMVLEKSLDEAQNLEAIVQIHNEYLDNVQEHCLQTPNFHDLMQTILQLLEMCNEVAIVWKPESLYFIGGILDSMENKYVKYHTSLALGLHNAVQHKNANYLTGLSSAFNCSVPST